MAVDLFRKMIAIARNREAGCAQLTCRNRPRSGS